MVQCVCFYEFVLDHLVSVSYHRPWKEDLVYLNSLKSTLMWPTSVKFIHKTCDSCIQNMTHMFWSDQIFTFLLQIFFQIFLKRSWICKQDIKQNILRGRKISFWNFIFIKFTVCIKLYLKYMHSTSIHVHAYSSFNSSPRMYQYIDILITNVASKTRTI